MGRKFVGMELDERYFAEARSRIAAAYGDWDNARKQLVIRNDVVDFGLFATT